MLYLFSWILGTSEWIYLISNPIDCFFQGLVGACGILVLCTLMRLYLFVQKCSDSKTENGRKHRSCLPASPPIERWKMALQFWCLTVVLSLVGSRVSSLIVLEFVLRAVSSWASPKLDATSRTPHLLLIQCQFSLGCGLTCTLIFLHEGAPHSSFSLFLAAALSWALAGFCQSLWSHAARLYPLHSSERYCGKCITLLTSGHNLLASLQKVVVLAFAVATVACTATVCDHFLSPKDALKFWTPLTLCYAMLVVHMQEEQDRQTVADALLRSVVLRLGALLMLMLMMGYWSDVFQILISFLGEAVCLLPSQDLLQPTLKEEDTSLSKYPESSTFSQRTREHTPKLPSDSS